MEGLRVVGEPALMASKYYELGADELLYVDTVASLYERDGILEIVKAATDRIFIPITVVGGIRTLDDAKKLFDSGADKVGLNTAALSEPTLITKIANIYGSQAVVLSIEAKQVASQRWHAYTNGGRDDSSIDVRTWIPQGIDRGAGEILITSVDRDGTGKGFDLKLIQFTSSITKVPFLISGGAGSVADVKEVAASKQVDGICIGKALHQNKIDLPFLRDEFKAAKIDSRIVYP